MVAHTVRVGIYKVSSLYIPNSQKIQEKNNHKSCLPIALFVVKDVNLKSGCKF